MKLIDKDILVAEIEKRIAAYRKNFDKVDINIARILTDGKIEILKDILSFLDGLEVKEVDLIDRKTDWSPSKKQMESLKDMLKYNIGVFDYQKWMEVNSLYEDLTNSKLFDETDRQK